MTKKMSNLPSDLVEEILSRVPVTSLGKIRFTCKKWNILSKNEIFTKKHLTQAAATSTMEGEFMGIVVMDYKVSLMRINLHGIQNNSDPSLNLISLGDSVQMDISRVYHCEGLVLCTSSYFTRLVVWNPYTGQNRLIYPQLRPYSYYSHALGYEMGKSCRSYKILRFAHQWKIVFEIYELNTSSWRVLDGTADWQIRFHNHGLSLKGNTYWYAEDLEYIEFFREFLICFDFTTERFGPRLPLPFESYCGNAVFLSSFREEQLAVLFQDCQWYEIKVWVTTMIEPDAVSWSKFFAVTIGFCFDDIGSFLIDEERRAVVVLDKDREVPTRDVAYIVGENGYYREVCLGEVTTDRGCLPLACSYIPSSEPINQPARGLWSTGFLFNAS